ncbi:cobyrinate a,c-diamide synthase [Frankia sp. AgB32]|uniref:cobyrinate a,c-diamide synthase n=1 Tax=Frankia sp. AgB32 TaxID=631119 RepID=UPI00200C10B8|nr:cobyrinate a,c-diamide synthase [Frankia sp. AgB32]MCK9896749.1 cobyrinate a,c-diamide synthase [Frankia sp. AgB32]
MVNPPTGPADPPQRLDLPRLVLAAPTSGAGKTTVATGLMAALRARGLRVSPHKVGPDYIDPSYHALATGRPGRNLDAVLCGPRRLAPLFAHGARGADIAIVEGVMGLFDGVAHPEAGQDADHASTAHVARLLDAPVVLVVDASGASRSIAALVSGFRSFDPRIHLAGVILNRVGTPRHRALLTDALADINMPVFGAVPRDPGVHTPSRHLGLVPAAERRRDALNAVERLGELITGTCDLDALTRLARAAPPLHTTVWNPHTTLDATAAPVTATTSTAPPPPPGTGQGRPARIAVAGGAAFTFGYPEHVELLAAAGAEVLTVDPLRDETLPAGTDALIIGGGFPEEHAGALSANAPLRTRIAAFAAAGHPVSAECAGLLYLARTLQDAPMCGVLAIDAVMGPRLTLGYRTAIAATTSPLAAAGTVLGAHEFHRTTLLPAPPGAPPAAWQLPAATDDIPTRRGGAPASCWRAEGFVHLRVHASYLHLHWAGQPDIARRLLRAAHDARRGAPRPAPRSPAGGTPARTGGAHRGAA